jgi:hypothetical protein
MKVWSALYAMIWIVLVEFILAMSPLWRPVTTYLHIALGVLLVAIAYSNFTALRATTVPGRVKRISYATFGLCLVMIPLGILVFFNVGTGWPILLGVSVGTVIIFLHVVNAFAIITQASAAAIAYDMWEEREFLADTRPGEVPPAPTPGRPSVPAP